MKKNFGFNADLNKIKVFARSLWMGFGHGEGELEIGNQGRFKKSRFSQETVAIGQQTPRNGEDRPKLRFTQRVSSAERTWSSDSTPQFFSTSKSQPQDGNSSVNFTLENFDFEGEVTREDFTRGTRQTQSALQDILKAVKDDEDSKL